MLFISAVTFTIAAGLSLGLTAVIRRVAPALGLLDQPQRRGHATNHGRQA